MQKTLSHDNTLPAPDSQFLLLPLLGASCLVLGAVIAWPTWNAVVRLLLPAPTATALLNWQRSLSSKEPALLHGQPNLAGLTTGAGR